GTARPAARGGGPATTAVSWPLPAGLTTKRTACRENRDRPDHLVNAGSRTAISPTDVSQVGDQAASIGGWHAIPYGIPCRLRTARGNSLPRNWEKQFRTA